MYIILAVSEDNVIGVNNKLPWRIPYDLLWFKMNTLGKTIVMGRKTWQSLGKKLKNRTNVVLSSTYQHGADIQYNDITTLKNNIPKDSVIIGGAGIAKEFLTVGNHLILTRVHISCSTKSSVLVDLPKLKVLWQSKTMSYKDIKFTFSINKIIS